jgi:hypothetical protein
MIRQAAQGPVSSRGKIGFLPGTGRLRGITASPLRAGSDAQ